MSDSTGFVRLEGHHLQLGKVLCYQLSGFPFRIITHREGIQIEGKSPILPPVGMQVIAEVLRLAAAHHAHLASFADGEPQTYLTEDQAMLRCGITPTETPFNPPRPTLVKM